MFFKAFHFSPTVETNAKSILMLTLLLSLTIGIGNMVAGTLGMWVGLLLHIGITAAVTWFSKEIVLWITNAKTVKEGKTPEGFDLCAMVDRLRQNPHINLSVMPQVCIVETNQKNAFATGRHQKHAAIAITRGLLREAKKTATNAEDANRWIEAILLHELGHIVNKDILIKTVASILAGSICHMSKVFYNQKQEENSGKHQIGKYITLYLLIPFSTTFLSLCLSRTREFAADDIAAKCGHAKDLANAFTLLKEEELLQGKVRSTTTPLDVFSGMMCASAYPTEDQQIATQLKAPETGFFKKCYLTYKEFHSTHPPLEERITRMNTWDENERSTYSKP